MSYTDRKAVVAALKPIYQAVDVDPAGAELNDFTRSDLGQKYPTTVATFDNAWERFIPFLAIPPELRRVIYTTNSIESLNYQLRKIIKNRGHFPNDDAAIKLLWLAICNIEDNAPAPARRSEAGHPANAEPPDDWSKDKSPPTGDKPSPNSHSHSPTASTHTYDNQPGVARTS